jgi:NodT family efflux transporter outer membrane factor (OMF) lipoprotein
MQSNYLKLSILFLLILGSCARVPDSDLAQLSEPIALDDSKNFALDREFFAEGGWPTERWWEMFEDPQLNQLVELALQESPTLQKALSRRAEAEQAAKKERAALFPEVDFDYEEQWEYFSKNGFIRSFYPVMSGVQIPMTADQIDLGLNFNYEIDFFGRNRNLYKAALDRARAERAETQQATLILTTLIVQTYIELQTKLAQREVLQDRLEQRNMLFELANSRGEHGLDPAIPVLEREQNVYTVEQSITLLDKGISLDQHMLNVLIGVGPDEDMHLRPMMALFEKPFEIPPDLSSDLLARRPDLTAQIWRVEAAARDIGAAKADFYPRVNLMAFAELESLVFNKLLKISSRQGGLVPAVHLPIFTGGRLTANLKEKVAAFNEETYRYNEMILNAAREVADQIVTLTATFDALSQQINSLETADDQFAVQFQRYHHGVDNFLKVLDKEENLLNQRYLLFGFERDYLLAALTLIKALGGGYHSHQLPKERG